MDKFNISMSDGKPIPARMNRAELVDFEFEGVFVPPASVIISGWTKIRQGNGSVQKSDVSSGVTELGINVDHEKLVMAYEQSVVSDLSKLFDPAQVVTRTVTRTE